MKMAVADLKPRNTTCYDPLGVWRVWGDEGRLYHLLGSTPDTYYLALLDSMRIGVGINPLEVGYWSQGTPGQVYVFNGCHRLACAQTLEWTHIEVVNSDHPESVPVIFADLIGVQL